MSGSGDVVLQVLLAILLLIGLLLGPSLIAELLTVIIDTGLALVAATCRRPRKRRTILHGFAWPSRLFAKLSCQRLGKR